jgi:UDP-N-acetylmuramoyl-tripeptide--D-alanyl-D-alanine ligase
MKIEKLHEIFLKSTGVCTDTRKISQGCLFFALKGDNFNGNTFAAEALDKGAYRVVIDEIGYHKNTGETILCANGLKLLQKLANYHRRYLNLPVIALTGSNGKTTTKELIHAVLKQKYDVEATQGNLNNHIGVPLTLLNMSRKTEMGIVEMGANHPKEIEQLCEIAMPDFGYITNFGKAHLEGFGSVEGVIKAKTELYQHLYKNKKTVFVNTNDPIQLAHSKNLKKVSFGSNSAEIQVKLKDASNTLVVEFDGIEIKSNLIGLYNFSNIAAAIAIGDYFKVPSEKIKTAIESYSPSNNRSQLIKKQTNSIILDAYNANPTSMLAALENFKQSQGKNKTLFLGDMFELGSTTELEHQYITDFLTENKIGQAYLIGNHFSKTISKSDLISKYKTFEELKLFLAQQSPVRNSHILIKASRGMALERILDLL